MKGVFYMSKVVMRIDDNLKKDAEALFNELGMNMTTAVTVFIKKAVRERRIPFEVSADYPNEATRASFDEVERMISQPSDYKSFPNAKEMMEDILKDEISN
jgi:DNA-damage-inducible protein J